jgi:hypothetical protein
MVDNEHFDWASRRLEPETQLFLQCREDRSDPGIGWRWRLPLNPASDDCTGDEFIGSEVQVDIECPNEAGLVPYFAAQNARKDGSQSGYRYRSPIDRTSPHPDGAASGLLDRPRR